MERDATADSALGGLQALRPDCAAACHRCWKFFGQIAVRFGKKIFFYDPFIFFKRTFNAVHVMGVLIGHRSYNSVIAMSLPAKK